MPSSWSPRRQLRFGRSNDAPLRSGDSHELSGLGIGYIDAYLLGSTMLTAGARPWTRDKRLAAVAANHGLERQRDSVVAIDTCVSLQSVNRTTYPAVKG